MKEIFNRYSPRAFNADKSISDADLISIFEAAKWAQSSFNNQPWRFFIANKLKDKIFYNEVLNLLSDFNKQWAINSPVLVVLSCLKYYEHNLKPNPTALFELGLATQNMVLKAMNLNIYSHIIGGFDKDGLQKLLNLDDKIEIVAIMVLGYVGNIVDLPEEIKKVEIEKKRIRKNLNEIVLK